MTAKEEFRRLETEAMNQQARVADALAMSGTGMLEEDYWARRANTVADRYVDIYGGKAIQTSGGNYAEASSTYGQGWTDADGTKWLPEVIFTTNRNDGTYEIGNDGYGAWHATARPDNLPLQVVGESTDGGLIWNTEAVSYPVPAPNVEVMSQPDADTGSIRPIGVVEGFLTFNPLGRAIAGAGTGFSDLALGLIETGKQAALTASDAAMYGWSGLNNALGSDIAYAPQSTLGRSIQTQGTGTTALNVVGGIVQGTVGAALQPLNALYRQDAHLFGQSLAGAALMATPLIVANNVNRIGASSVSAASRLRFLGNTTWEPPLGLKYGPDVKYGNRIQHDLRHTDDQPLRPGLHGVFDVGRRNVVSIVDEAWSIVQKEGINVTSYTVGNKSVYAIDMGRRIGWIGGQGGTALGNPAASSVQLVIRSGNQVITAYPIR